MQATSPAAVDEASWLRLEPLQGETLRSALSRSLTEAIRSGALRAGVRLPSSRRLAAEMGVSRGVASDVYAQLAAQGFVSMRQGSAPVVAAVARAPAPVAAGASARADWRWDMTPTTPDVTLFPTRDWLAAMSHAARRAPARALDYGDPRGDLGLRSIIADHAGRTRW